MKFTIEAAHSKWGPVKLEATRHSYKDPNGDEHQTYLFFYPTGVWMGELDSEMGGGLGHPNEHVQKFLLSVREVDSGNYDLFDMDEEAYMELEDLIEDIIRSKDPGFFIIPADDGRFDA